MKLITLNTWQGRLFRNFVPFFNQQQADIICLQELNKTDIRIPTQDSLNTWNDLKQSTKLPYSFYSPVWYYEVMGEKAEFGNGTLSRFSIKKTETLFTNGEYHKVTADNYKRNVRNAQIITLEINGQELVIVNYQAHWESNSMGTPTSLERIKILVERLRTVKGPLILAGDFNLQIESEALQYLMHELNVKDLTAEAHIENTLQNSVTEYKVACDHIFVSPEIIINSFEVSDKLLSDHKALIVDFDIK